METLRKSLIMICLIGSVIGLAEATAETKAKVNYWEKYCGGGGAVAQDSAAIPKPDYSQSLIKKVAKKFTNIEVIEYNARTEDEKFEEQKNGTTYVKSMAFSPYTDFERSYGLCASSSKYLGRCKPEQMPPKGVGINTHNMLTILCGEYRDNVTMLKKKLSWLSRVVVTPKKKQGYAKSKKVFDQLTSDGYKAMVEISAKLYDFRKEELGESLTNRYLTLEQKSIEPMTVCEYRHILDRYISKQKEVESAADFTAYKSSLKEYNTGVKFCKATDKKYFYEFRGDGNFKAQSLESNGQLWYSRSFANACTKNRKVGRKGYRGSVTPEECVDYFKNPYKTRAKINEQAMLKMFFFPNKAQGLDIHKIMSTFDSADPNGTVFVTEDINGDGLGELVVLDPEIVKTCSGKLSNSSSGACIINQARKMLANFSDYSWDELNKADELLYHIVVLAAEKQLKANPAYAKIVGKSKRKAKKLFSGSDYLKGVKLITEAHPLWKKSYLKSKDRGFTRIFKSKEEAWDRMAIVLDRHTDWYSIDTLHIKNGYFKPTFSPWIASSYYIYNSHSFTLPGYAMNMDLDPGRMHWMYVQKISKTKWYNASNMNKKWPESTSKFDIMNFWFDEVTFSRSNLGAGENGWDRFGGVAASEMESILWLYEAEKFNFHH